MQLEGSEVKKVFHYARRIKNIVQYCQNDDKGINVST